MVAIKAGKFLMGSKADPFSKLPPNKDEMPQHEVSIKSFSLGRLEVTQEQWYAVMGTLPSKFKGRTLPVEQVSWNDVQEFLKKLSDKTGKNYRLPSEAEWEYAARGGSQTAYSFGDDEKELHIYAWYDKNSGMQSQPVGEKLPNAFGLHDMHGNISEFVHDCWNDNYVGAPINGNAWKVEGCTHRVHRGGFWNRTEYGVRAADRSFIYSADSFSFVGFRVARDN
jgi:formylglycine-generating enzyme required for sulfatase activity